MIKSKMTLYYDTYEEMLREKAFVEMYVVKCKVIDYGYDRNGYYYTYAIYK